MLVGSILAWGALVGIALIWFFSDKLRFVTGLATGTGLAVFMAVHISIVVRDSIDGSKSPVRLKIMAAMRYPVVLLVMVIMCVTKAGSPIPAFLGLIGLKAGAYFTILRINKRELHQSVIDS